MKKIIFCTLLFTIGCSTINKLSHLDQDIDGWWYINPQYYTCSDTDIDRSFKPSQMEENFEILDGGCTRTLNDQKNILLLTCYTQGQKYEFAYFKTEVACNKFASSYKK